MAIADRLATDPSYDFDVVALQEVWCHEDWQYFDGVLKLRYPYRRYFKSGIVAGPGLAILSKIPIESTFLYRFPVNGRPSAFFRGDWLVGKSILVTLLKTSAKNSVPLAVLNSHMHAPYSASGDAAYECHRACQAWDFAKIALMLRKAGYAVFVVGDLNLKPGSLPFRLLTQETGLRDSWNALWDGTEKGLLTQEDICKLDPLTQISEAAVTCDSQLNTWRETLPLEKACRLDYILISDKLEPVDALVKFTEPLEGIGSYSDHFAYFAELRVNNKPTVKTDTNHQEMIQNLKELQSLVENYQNNTILSWLQLKWRALHVIISLVIVVGFHVMASFTSSLAPWSSVLLIFGTFGVTVFAVINLLIVVLFLPKEYRALEEVKLEAIDTEKSLLLNK